MRTRPFVLAITAASLFGGALVASATAATTTWTISGIGLSSLRLGTSESATVATLTHALGHPSAPLTSTPALRLCGVSATIGWESADVYFNHNRLVGLSFGPGHTPSVQTTAGLKLGDRLRRARALYGRRLTTSLNQGGAWFVSTPLGRIDGFLNPSTGTTPTPSARIWTIDVGVVGCPAQSP